jgi:hypothetical protein
MNTFKRKALFTAVLAGLAAAGCTTLPGPTAAAAAPVATVVEKDANINCGSFAGALSMYDVGVLSMSIDAGVVQNGELDVKCGQNSVKFTNKRGLR